MAPLCRDQGIGMIPWSPLARGSLTRAPDLTTTRSETDRFGKFLYKKTEESDRAIIDRVGALAEARNVSRAQVALSWLLHKPGVSAPIVGATKPEHLVDAANAVSLQLTPAEIQTLEELYAPHPVAGFI